MASGKSPPCLRPNLANLPVQYLRTPTTQLLVPDHSLLPLAHVNAHGTIPLRK